MFRTTHLNFKIKEINIMTIRLLQKQGYNFLIPLLKTLKIVQFLMFLAIDFQYIKH